MKKHPFIIGILALQGAFIEHQHILKNVETRLIKTPEDVKGISGLILPGGESTTISKLLHKSKLFTPIQKAAKNGLPMFGTCAGAILLAKKVVGKNTPATLSLIDIEISRNAYGSQLDSFEENITFKKLTIPAVFIRAPLIKNIGENVSILAKNSHDEIVCAEEKNLLVATFHPELTSNLEIHNYFLEKCKQHFVTTETN